LAEVKNKTPEKLKQIKPCKNKNLEVLVVVKRKKVNFLEITEEMLQCSTDRCELFTVVNG